MKKDAAKLIQQEPWTNLQSALNVYAEKVFDESKDVPTLSDKKPSPLSVDKVHENSRFDFMFVDTSPSLTQKESTVASPTKDTVTSSSKKPHHKVLVRDRKGVLRPASALEKWYKRRGPRETFIMQ